MKLVTFNRQGNADHVGVLVDDDQNVIDVTAADQDRPELRSMQDLIEAGDAGLDAVRAIVDATRVAIPLAEITILCPVPVPAQLRDALCFETHLKGAFRVARKLAIAGASDSAAKQREVDELGLYQVPDVWYQQPIYYKGNRF